MKKLVLTLLLFTLNSWALDYKIKDDNYQYNTPSTFQFATTLPNNGVQFLKNSFSFTHDNLVGWGTVIASSAILIHYDQKISNSVQNFGRKIGIGNEENSRPTLIIGDNALLRRPTDLGSAMYFIGDGWVTLGLTSAFMGTGLATSDQRALTVGHELLQGLLLTGITTQLIKRSTGRESPNKSSTPGGVWRFFPHFSVYQNNISKHDAFPSGHLATTMTTFMILSENYSEYAWIKPVGITLMGLLSFEMVNNSVHWAGDYPLALGIGYVLGKTIVENGRKKINDENNNETQKVSIIPFLTPDGKMGLNGSLSF